MSLPQGKLENLLPMCPETPEGGSDNFVYFTKSVRQDLPGVVPEKGQRSAKSGTGSKRSCERGVKENLKSSVI